MLKNYFDQIYVINLDSRGDRLAETDLEFKKIGAPFTKVSAVDGYKENLLVNPYDGYDPNYWNQGAAGLLKTTEKILKDAISNGYGTILICEDDIEFDPKINEYSRYLKDVPNDWQMVLMGSQHMSDPMPVTDQIAKVKFAFCLHCYAVKSDIFEYYLHLVQKAEKQLDLITAEDIQPMGKTYCFTPNMAFQRSSFSDIQKQNVNYAFLKSTKVRW